MAERTGGTPFAHGLFGQRDPAAVDSYVAPGFINHNPHAAPGPDGVKGFVEHFLGQFPQASAESRRMAAQGDLVFVHGLLKTGPENRGSALVDVFRVARGESSSIGT